MQAERGSDLSTIPQKCRAWPGGNPDRLWPQEVGSQTLMRTQTAWSTKGSPADQGCPKNEGFIFPLHPCWQTPTLALGWEGQKLRPPQGTRSKVLETQQIPALKYSFHRYTLGAHCMLP